MVSYVLPLTLSLHNILHRIQGVLSRKLGFRLLKHFLYFLVEFFLRFFLWFPLDWVSDFNTARTKNNTSFLKRNILVQENQRRI